MCPVTRARQAGSSTRVLRPGRYRFQSRPRFGLIHVDPEIKEGARRRRVNKRTRRQEGFCNGPRERGGWGGESVCFAKLRRCCLALVEVRVCRPPRVYLLERLKGASRVSRFRRRRRLGETEQSCAIPLAASGRRMFLVTPIDNNRWVYAMHGLEKPMDHVPGNDSSVSRNSECPKRQGGIFRSARLGRRGDTADVSSARDIVERSWGTNVSRCTVGTYLKETEIFVSVFLFAGICLPC